MRRARGRSPRWPRPSPASACAAQRSGVTAVPDEDCRMAQVAFWLPPCFLGKLRNSSLLLSLCFRIRSVTNKLSLSVIKDLQNLEKLYGKRQVKRQDLWRD
ncbi:uncharacterized protein WM277_024719 isoform 1-T1 [Molossus nigricans]